MSAPLGHMSVIAPHGVSVRPSYRTSDDISFCRTTSSFCVSERKGYWGSGSFSALLKEVVLPCCGEINSSLRVSHRDSNLCQRVVYFFPRRNGDSFINKLAKRTEDSVTEEEISGRENRKDPERRTGGEEHNIRSREEKVGRKITPDDVSPLKASFCSESEPEDENLVVIPVSLPPESKEIKGRKEPADDYSSEPLQQESEEAEYVTRITVPRQRYIRIPKAKLVDVLSSFSSASEMNLSSVFAVLELILHAKHKFLLEELRADYSVRHSTSDSSPDLLKGSDATSGSITEQIVTSGDPCNSSFGEGGGQHEFDLPAEAGDVNGGTNVDNTPTQNELPKWKAWVTKFLGAFRNWKGAEFASHDEAQSRNGETEDEETRTTSAKRFQRNFLKLLRNAQFEGLSVSDLELTAALNSDYLLTLPISVDWKRTSNSNAVIYRRGYAKEQQTGLLLGAKFDYLQAALLRASFNGLTRPLISTGHWFIQKWRSLRNDPQGKALAETVERWVEEPLQPAGGSFSEDKSDDESAKETEMPSMESEMDLPIWKAAQQAVPRYEAVLSSAGSRGLLLRGILVRMGFLPPESSPEILSGDEDSRALEPHLRPSFISRVSVKDIWFPASKAVVGANVWKRFRAAVSVFLTRVTLQEPAFQELVLLYFDDDREQSEASSLQLQMYKTIPLPELKIIFPSKKLSFRLIDTLRLDLTTFVGLAAFLYNYHFEDFLYSPSAFALDVIAASALVVVVLRAALGYKQTSDRYQLLVNRTLYEKTLANGFGVVHFLIDASEEQQFKEAILAFSILSEQGMDDGMTKEELASACERFLYYQCKEQTEMPVENALKNLIELGLVYPSERVSTPSALALDSGQRYTALPYDKGLEALRCYWELIPSSTVSLTTK